MQLRLTNLLFAALPTYNALGASREHTSLPKFVGPSCRAVYLAATIFAYLLRALHSWARAS